MPRPRLVLARAPAGRGATRSGSSAGGSSTGARCRTRTTSSARTDAAALRHAAGARRARCPRAADEIDEVRIVGTYLASHPETPQLALDPPPDAERLTALRSARSAENGSATTSAGTARRRRRREPGRRLAADERQRDRPEPGETTALPTRPTAARRSRARRPAATGAAQPQPPQLTVRLAAVVQPRDRLLADVAALRERHRALVEPGLLGDHACRRGRCRSAGGRARPAALGGGLGDRRRARRLERGAQRARCRRRRTAGRRRRRCGSRGRRPRRSSTSSWACSARRQLGGAGDRAGRGPISESRPRSSVRLCSSTS